MKTYKVLEAAPKFSSDNNPKVYDRCLVVDESTGKIWSVGGTDGTQFENKEKAIECQMEYIRTHRHANSNNYKIEEISA
jgi:hypothetical protein